MDCLTGDGNVDILMNWMFNWLWKCGYSDELDV